jgi:hypothetical protein
MGDKQKAKKKEEDSLIYGEGLVNDPVDIQFATVPLFDEEVSF